VVQSQAHERADALRNRERILTAAARLFARNGARGTSMDAIAAEAGVGKGTLFRRFRDRAALMLALLDQADRAFQEAILRGPPPLGPGASPRERLIAFGQGMLAHLECHGELLLEIEACHPAEWQRSQPYAFLWLHARALLDEARLGGDSEYLADALLATLTPSTFHHQRSVRGLSLERLKLGFRALVDAIVSGEL
jgi:AcrR family transcriptional regulator